jgi:hypothetical protein
VSLVPSESLPPSYPESSVRISGSVSNDESVDAEDSEDSEEAERQACARESSWRQVGIVRKGRLDVGGGELSLESCVRVEDNRDSESSFRKCFGKLTTTVYPSS